jgi:hypothetical protein
MHSIVINHNEGDRLTERLISLSGTIRSRDHLAMTKATAALKEATLYSPHSYRYAAQLEALFKKNADFRDEAVCINQARLNFERAERLCRITNRRLDFYDAHPERCRIDSTVTDRVKREIAKLVGPADTFIAGIPQLVKVTGGATASTPKSKSQPHRKMRDSYSVTVGAAPYALALSEYLTGIPVKLELTNCNRITTVPKTSLTDRTIAAEPMGNLPFQLAVDTYLKPLLRSRWGIDLEDQSRNQEAARLGSITGELATIDLSMASDTLSLNTVLALFPEDWCEVLMRLRSPCYKGIFGYGTYSKFSSMGNGFTFVLETIIFTAFCRAVGSSEYRVYGDDIVIETNLYTSLLELLKYFGFVPNTEKSFSTGPFRESCGADFIDGVNVRPFYYRASPKSGADASMTINGLIAQCLPEGHVWELTCKAIRCEWLPLVPFNHDDRSGVHIHPIDARSIGVLRMAREGPYESLETFKCYNVVSSRARRLGLRSYMLWHFLSATCGKKESMQELLSVAHVTRYQTRTRARIWHMPDLSPPTYLYLLSEEIR